MERQQRNKVRNNRAAPLAASGLVHGGTNNHARTFTPGTGIHRQTRWRVRGERTPQGDPRHHVQGKTHARSLCRAWYWRDTLPSTAPGGHAGGSDRHCLETGRPAESGRALRVRTIPHAAAADRRAGTGIAPGPGARRDCPGIAAGADPGQWRTRNCDPRGKKNAPAAREDTEVALTDPKLADQETLIRTEPEPSQPAQPDVHLSILQQLLKLTASPAGSRLGPAGQQPRRQLERRVRQCAIELARRLIERGDSHAEVAQRLAINERTLRSWSQLDDKDPPVHLLGRPLQSSDAAQQQALVDLLDNVGPGLGMPTLRTRFPNLA